MNSYPETQPAVTTGLLIGIDQLITHVFKFKDVKKWFDLMQAGTSVPSGVLY